MIRWLVVTGIAVVTVALAALAFTVSAWWWIPTAVVLFFAVVGFGDLLQRRHSVLRNYPILGHMRFLLEDVRPEIQQYFIERANDGTPFAHDTRALVYKRAKGLEGDNPFGTERNVNQIGYEFVPHSLGARKAPDARPRVTIGGPDCEQPYEMAMLNVSAMSFGALSANAIEALNGGAALGGFAHDTGEGGLSPYHRKPGGDLIWEIGSGYFGCRTDNGNFDQQKFSDKANLDQVKCVSIKLSQGAKPGLGGVLPGPKVNEEIAATRGVPVGKTVISPPAHSAFSTPTELLRFVRHLRGLTSGKPIGFKLCVGSRTEFLGICKAMLDTGITPDFIIVDGAEGGTGAAPLEFEDHVGMPLTDGLMTVHNALVGTGLRDKIKIGASGKVASGIDIVKRVIQGADFTLAARAMMFAIGCIQAQKCHTNKCPVGVATQDPRRARALDVPDKTQRVAQFQSGTVDSATQIIASMGLDDFHQLNPSMLHRRIDAYTTQTYAQIHEWLAPEVLLHDPPMTWRSDWADADANAF